MQEATHFETASMDSVVEQKDAPKLGERSTDPARVLGSRTGAILSLVVGALASAWMVAPTASVPDAMPTDFVVDLNLATEAELSLLPGVGPKLASDILRYRAEHHGFRSVEELMNIRGIKLTRFQSLAPHAMVHTQVEFPLRQVDTPNDAR